MSRSVATQPPAPSQDDGNQHQQDGGGDGVAGKGRRAAGAADGDRPGRSGTGRGRRRKTGRGCRRGRHTGNGGGGVRDSICPGGAIGRIPGGGHYLGGVEWLEGERGDSRLAWQAGAECAPAGAPVQRTEDAAGTLVAVTAYINLVGICRVEGRDIEVTRWEARQRAPGDTAIIGAKEAGRGPGQHRR